MREFLKRSHRALTVGWFWPLVLLALPNCALSVGGIPAGFEFEPGDEPRTSAVMCDIPTVPETNPIFRCATPDDIQIGLASTRGAVALNLGESNTVKLDYSPESDAQCGAGIPRRMDQFDLFPTGTTVCLNCTQQIGTKYTDPTAVCVAKCRELVHAAGSLPDNEIDGYCAANAKVSTNFDPTMCFDDVCLTGGTPKSPFPDPRLKPELLSWTDPQGNIEIPPFQNNNVTFLGPGGGTFTAGAASGQVILSGDAWIEFEAGENTVSHVIGVRTSCEKIADCPDTDGTLGDLKPLVLNLNYDKATNVVEIPPSGIPNVLATFPNYSAGERFRIYVEDNHDGTANIKFSRLTSSCADGAPCNDNKFYTHPAGAGPHYPLRVDVSFREAPANINNVTIMRLIKK